jgi:hypothetical protein
MVAERAAELLLGAREGQSAGEARMEGRQVALA